MTPIQQLLSLIAVAAEPEGTKLHDATWLLNNDMILRTELKNGMGVFALSDRGRAFVDHICALPLPEQVFIWRVGDLFTAPVRVQGSLSAPTPIDEGPPPPPAPPAKRINRVTVPEDPEEKRALGINLMNNGMGVGEVAELLGVSFEEADSYFTGK